MERNDERLEVSPVEEDSLVLVGVHSEPLSVSKSREQGKIQSLGAVPA